MKYSRGKIGDIEDRRRDPNMYTGFRMPQSLPNPPNGATVKPPTAHATPKRVYPGGPIVSNKPQGIGQPRRPGPGLGNLAANSIKAMKKTARKPTTTRPTNTFNPGAPAPKAPVVKAQAAKPKTSRPGANNPNARRAK